MTTSGSQGPVLGVRVDVYARLRKTSVQLATRVLAHLLYIHSMSMLFVLFVKLKVKIVLHLTSVSQWPSRVHLLGFSVSANPTLSEAVLSEAIFPSDC